MKRFVIALAIGFVAANGFADPCRDPQGCAGGGEVIAKIRSSKVTKAAYDRLLKRIEGLGLNDLASKVRERGEASVIERKKDGQPNIVFRRYPPTLAQAEFFDVSQPGFEKMKSEDQERALLHIFTASMFQGIRSGGRESEINEVVTHVFNDGAPLAPRKERIERLVHANAQPKLGPGIRAPMPRPGAAPAPGGPAPAPATPAAPAQ